MRKFEVHKPSPEIFRHALKNAGCPPQVACMIGDRLDNDIEPAAKLGMHTIWIKQGTFADGNLSLIQYKPDMIAETTMK